MDFTHIERIAAENARYGNRECANCRYWDREHMSVMLSPNLKHPMAYAPCKREYPDDLCDCLGRVFMREDSPCAVFDGFRVSLRHLKEYPELIARAEDYIAVHLEETRLERLEARMERAEARRQFEETIRQTNAADRARAKAAA